ncbi:MAG: NifU family protein [Microbacterium sp.]
MAAVDVIEEVLSLLGPMVATDGGSMRIAEYSESESRLVVDYTMGTNDACAACVIDPESLKAFVEEGIRARGVEVAEVSIVESAASASIGH